MGVIIKKIRVDMNLKDYDEEKTININEIYYAKNFNLNNLKKLDGNIKIVEIDCKKCIDGKSLWKEYDNLDLLPQYFGNNWDAFYDSIDYFEFFDDYDLVVFILNDFNIFMKEEKLEGLYLYKRFKESLAFKKAQKNDNRPPLTYIFNIQSDEMGIISDINWLYRNMEMKLEVHIYDD